MLNLSEEALIHEFHFQREVVVDINAAVIGISRSRWTALTPDSASDEHAQKVMKADGFDILPIDDGRQVREYFHTRDWSDYTSIARKAITYRDVISYQTPIRDVIKGFVADQRNFYFLGTENRIVGLVSVANLNCRQMQTYLFSLFCELETAMATSLSSAMTQDEIRSDFSQSQSRNVSGVEKRYNDDLRCGVDAPYVEYLYFSDLIGLITPKQWASLNISPARQADLKELKEWRNRVAHPTKSLIRKPEDVESLWCSLDSVEEILFQFRHDMEGELQETVEWGSFFEKRSRYTRLSLNL